MPGEKYEDLGGRAADWDRLSEPRVQVDPAEAKEAGERDVETWEPGTGHRVLKINDRWRCVVCGDDWSEWPTATCPGPLGVAL